jgi:hypothetical protein
MNSRIQNIQNRDWFESLAATKTGKSKTKELIEPCATRQESNRLPDFSLTHDKKYETPIHESKNAKKFI